MDDGGEIPCTEAEWFNVGFTEDDKNVVVVYPTQGSKGGIVMSREMARALSLAIQMRLAGEEDIFRH